MAVADTSPVSPTPPTPDTCVHPAPVEGVMAHEFGHYARAVGPEGLRRTVTHYGPVVGGLPIAAWHCETCGLLRLRFPDGRREERQMFAGPQPGLLARPAAHDPVAEFGGRQARVSGLSVSRDMLPVLHAADPITERPRRFTVPDLGVVDWFSIAGLVAVGIGLLVTAILAVYDYQTSPYMNRATIATGAVFTAVIVLQIVAAAWRHWLGTPPLAPLPGETSAPSQRLDGVTVTIVTLMCITMAAGLLGAILATYDYETSGLMWPTVIVGVTAFLLAILIAIGRAAADHFGVPDDDSVL